MTAPSHSFRVCQNKTQAAVLACSWRRRCYSSNGAYHQGRSDATVHRCCRARRSRSIRTSVRMRSTSTSTVIALVTPLQRKARRRSSTSTACSRTAPAYRTVAAGYRQRTSLNRTSRYDGNRVAYVSAAERISFANGLDTPTTASFGSVYVYDISNGGNALNLTAKNSSGIVFSDVRHPSWAPGGSDYRFCRSVGSGPAVPYLQVVNVQTGLITQLTTGTSNDTSPAWAPGRHR